MSSLSGTFTEYQEKLLLPHIRVFLTTNDLVYQAPYDAHVQVVP